MSAPELLKAQMPLVRLVEANLASYGYVKGTEEYSKAFEIELAFFRKYAIITA